MSTVDLISITALVRKIQAEIPEIEVNMIEDNEAEFLVPKAK